jgi:hypothetical protein
VVHVNVIIDEDPLNYDSLKNMLSIFYCLRSITIKGETSQTMAKRILATLPMAPSIIDLKLCCNSALKTILDKHVQSITKRSIMVEVDGLMKPI